MYAYIKGIIINKQPDHLVLENNGIGYLIQASAGLLERFPQSGAEALVHLHHYVREDTIALYGFPDKEDLDMFRLLLTVSGIGPKVASTMVGSISPGPFALAVVTGDTKSLTAVRGIGRKGAERMILELKDKLKNADLSTIASAESSDLSAALNGSDRRQAEAVSALMVLGYTGAEAARAVSLADQPDLPVEELVRLSLRQLAR